MDLNIHSRSRCEKTILSIEAGVCTASQLPPCMTPEIINPCHLPARRLTPDSYLPQTRSCLCPYKKRIATMICFFFLGSDQGGGCNHRALVAGDPALPSHLPCIIDVLRNDSEPLMFYFCPSTPHRRGGSTASCGLPSFLGRRYEGGPEHHSFSEHFYGAIPFEYWHGNFSSMAKTTVTPGRRKAGSPHPSLSHSFNGTRAAGST
ncbi:hypothetical protein BGW80DRAFT_92054 [Lactifluus volemus]|nr:hypothetical protein BGW80DRAFT_92054 [Lactifluus volemus]